MLPSDVSSRRSSGVAAGGAARISPGAGPTSRMYSATPPRSHATSSDSPATAGAAKSSVAAMTVAWRARRPARLIDRRGGPRYGPPASSSEGGYAPLGLPRPSLGRAPAQPWRASGLTQDVSSHVHHARRPALGLDRLLLRLVHPEQPRGRQDEPPALGEAHEVAHGQWRVERADRDDVAQIAGLVARALHGAPRRCSWRADPHAPRRPLDVGARRQRDFQRGKADARAGLRRHRHFLYIEVAGVQAARFVHRRGGHLP